MTDAETDAVHDGAPDAAAEDAAPAPIGLIALGSEVEWPDADAAAAARAADDGTLGALSEAAEWLATIDARYPPPLPQRPRCVVFGTVPPEVATLAADLDVGVREEAVDTDDVATALAQGVRVADEEVDAGADVVVVARPEAGADPHSREEDAAAVLVSVLTGAEPVALLPRGAAATDTAAWIARAQRLRDTRREVADQRAEPDELLAALGDPGLAAVVGFVMRAVARRSAVVLDGPTAVAAALLAYDVQSRCGRWWRVADASTDPVHARAVEELVAEPLLRLGLTRADGTAGLLTLPLLRAATRLVRHDE